MKDLYQRSIDYMRISITDRCNLRCSYCMPNGIQKVEHDEILTYEEILRICRLSSEIGIKKIKITGGEPLVRKDAIRLIKQIKDLPKISQVTLTTNGVLLEDHLDELKKISLDGINISLDCIDPKVYKQITGRDEFTRVWSGLQKAIESGIPTKINCVPQKGINDHQLLDLVDFAVNMPVDVRFIEIMPIGYGKEFEGITSQEIYDMIVQKYPDVRNLNEVRGNGPAKYITSKKWRGNVGFIDAISHKFCASCNRIRLTANGFLKPCLCYGAGTDLKTIIRKGALDSQILSELEETIRRKPLEHNFGELIKGNENETREMFKIGG